MVEIDLYLSAKEREKLENTAKLCESSVGDFVEALVTGCLDEGINLSDFCDEERVDKEPLLVSIELTQAEFDKLELEAKKQACTPGQLVKHLVFKALI